jgi:threonine dehydrogenase-like Zn-dependent dehydrogenase
MKALRYHSPRKVSVDDVAEPTILAPSDAIVRVTSTAICGSDLHLMNGYVPTVQKDDILGHEFMGVVETIGENVRDVRVGDRVLVPFTIACGGCSYCKSGFTSLCDNSNPNAELADFATGHSPSGLYGFSHIFGGYPGGQAEKVRVIFADANLFKVPDQFEDEQVLFLTDIFPTGYQAAEQCDIKPGDVVAIWGCGPVGLFTIASALMLGAARVIAIDRIPDRLERAERLGAEVINFDRDDVIREVNRRTGGRGPDAVIDAVGLEAHAMTPDALLDKAKQVAKVAFDRIHVVRQAIYVCAKGGVVSIPGAYVGLVDLFPLGQAFAKGLRLRMGQTNVHRYVPTLMEHIANGRIDPRTIITHRFPLSEAAEAYELFMDKGDACQKVVLHTHAA